MYIWIETIEATLENSEEAKLDITIDVKNFGSEHQVLFSHNITTPLVLPDLVLDADCRVNSEIGCVMCPSDTAITTSVIKQYLDKFQEGGAEIHKIKCDDAENKMVDFEDIRKRFEIKV